MHQLRGIWSWLLACELLKYINHKSNNCLFLCLYLIPRGKAVAKRMPKAKICNEMLKTEIRQGLTTQRHSLNTYFQRAIWLFVIKSFFFFAQKYYLLILC